jgi:hypothetical protein
MERLARCNGSTVYGYTMPTPGPTKRLVSEQTDEALLRLDAMNGAKSPGGDDVATQVVAKDVCC